MSFALCLPIILKNEGGFVNNPQDPGGPTNLGITIGTLSGWLGRTATVQDVQALTADTVAPIYQAKYWNVCQCDSCPAGVDLMVFDEAVNQGPERAILSLQAAVGAAADGAFGPATLAAVQACDPTQTINAIAANRQAYYQRLPTFAEFGRGWLARVQNTQAAALGMVNG